ncbi:MAG: TldD/PmbA family protein [candidate division Zixibacteria bacterium]|nr:TldD/PmbA family protein [candidate division Zixibacteria bacterium]
MDRRKFIKTGLSGLALAAVPLVFKLDPSKAFAAPGGNGMLKDYYRHFEVDESTIRKIMSIALDKGGDYCDLYFQHRIGNWIGLEDKTVNQAYTTIDYGVGIRVVKGEQTGYSFTEEITPKAMELAAKTAANIANEAKNIAPVELTYHKTPNYYPIKTIWEDVGIDRKIPYLQKINDRMFDKDNRVIKSQIWFSNSSDYILIATSDGKIVHDYRPMASIYCSCTAEENGKREQNGFTLSARQGMEYFTPENLNYLADEAVRRTVNLFKAVKPEGGEMPVVLEAGRSGILLHEAIGHGMEADFNRKGISIYADKMNKKVAEDFVSIVDDGTNLNERGSINVDDEANDTEKTFLVRDGVLRSYLHDRISANYYKVNPTGNGRRQSFRHMPMPRMRNTYMLPGPHKRDEIIESVKNGLYAEAFSNGEVHIGAGDFTFYVKSGYLIENGKLTKPVKDINIIGNGPEVLTRVEMVADDLKLAESGGTCGKNGQWAPVSLGLPTIKVSSITVGGIS